MNNKIPACFLSAALIFSSSLHAFEIPEENNACRINGDTIFAYYNGVMSSHDSALDNLALLRDIHGVITSDGGVIDYDLMFNHTKGYQDFIEIFEQRFKEQPELRDRWEFFSQVLNDHGSWWDKIVLKIPELIINPDHWRNKIKESLISNLSSLFSNLPEVPQNNEEHQTKLDSWIIEGKKLLLVAHSQGNYYSNIEYDYVKNKISTDSVKAIHIAPAAPIADRPYVLADQDLVINGLRNIENGPTVPIATHQIPVFNPLISNNGRDFLSHGLIETYMNPAFGMYESINKHINQALTDLIIPPAQANQGLFTATLIWDGPGDVDLHVYEPPEGKHIYQLNPSGETGYLDVDNRVGFGPEHFYSTCDKTKISEGIYKISLANYGRAEGRNATVQISSDAAGVLGTKSVILGEATEYIPTHDMFNVKVDFNENTKKYNVSIE